MVPDVVQGSWHFVPSALVQGLSPEPLQEPPSSYIFKTIPTLPGYRTDRTAEGLTLEVPIGGDTSWNFLPWGENRSGAVGYSVRDVM